MNIFLENVKYLSYFTVNLLAMFLKVHDFFT